jgi:regulator of protease activity HflC (stomatin/prohibitin superfamily)
VNEPSSAVERAIAERIAAARRREAERKQQREELAAARTAGVARRHAQKLYRQAASTTEETPMPAAVRSIHCPACRRERIARLVATVIVSGAPYNVLRCPDSSCELQWLVRGNRPRTAPVAA